jgi:hypothetical protein
MSGPLAGDWDAFVCQNPACNAELYRVAEAEPAKPSWSCQRCGRTLGADPYGGWCSACRDESDAICCNCGIPQAKVTADLCEHCCRTVLPSLLLEKAADQDPVWDYQNTGGNVEAAVHCPADGRVISVSACDAVYEDDKATLAVDVSDANGETLLSADVTVYGTDIRGYANVLKALKGE